MRHQQHAPGQPAPAAAKQQDGALKRVALTATMTGALLAAGGCGDDKADQERADAIQAHLRTAHEILMWNDAAQELTWLDGRISATKELLAASLPEWESHRQLAASLAGLEKRRESAGRDVATCKVRVPELRGHAPDATIINAAETYVAAYGTGTPKSASGALGFWAIAAGIGAAGALVGAGATLAIRKKAGAAATTEGGPSATDAEGVTPTAVANGKRDSRSVQSGEFELPDEGRGGGAEKATLPEEGSAQQARSERETATDLSAITHHSQEIARGEIERALREYDAGGQEGAHDQPETHEPQVIDEEPPAAVADAAPQNEAAAPAPSTVGDWMGIGAEPAAEAASEKTTTQNFRGMADLVPTGRYLKIPMGAKAIYILHPHGGNGVRMSAVHDNDGPGVTCGDTESLSGRGIHEKAKPLGSKGKTDGKGKYDDRIVSEYVAALREKFEANKLRPTERDFQGEMDRLFGEAKNAVAAAQFQR